MLVGPTYTPGSARFALLDMPPCGFAWYFICYQVYFFFPHGARCALLDMPPCVSVRYFIYLFFFSLPVFSLSRPINSSRNSDPG